uniref:Chaperonin-like RbcX protein 2, chloroplastic n=1 Tax=Aegilops tauschii TaxID=37682 RepID=M8BQM6_AEGTA
MTGVQVMPGVGAVTTVDVRTEGGKAVAGLARRRVAVGSSSSTSLFAGDWRRRPRRATCSVRLRHFVAVNKPTDGKLFLRALGKERQELAERVMITRLSLYGKWIKKCDHAKMYEKISNENLELMRERLMETVIWPTDDTNTEKIG